MKCLNQISKRSLIVETSDLNQDVWTVYPTPGFVVKFKNLKFVDKDQNFLNNLKFFINVAHCNELPPPANDLEEDAVVKLIADDPHSFKIPISVGNLDSVEDKKGENAFKVDVLVNSNFYHKKIIKSEFFRQLTLLIICDAIELQYKISVDVSDQIILKNKKVVGVLNAQNIKNKAKKESETNHDLVKEKKQLNDLATDALPNNSEKRPKNCKVQIIDGNYLNVLVKLKDEKLNAISNLERFKFRITLKMNNDRCVVILDDIKTVADLYFPFYIKEDEVKSEFDLKDSTLQIKCPIFWNTLL